MSKTIPLNPWIIPVFLVLSIGIFLLYRHAAHLLRWRVWATAGVGLALAGVLALTLTPKDDGNTGISCTLVPTTFGLAELPALTGASLNTLLLVPVGLLTVLATRRLWMAVVVVVVLPIGIEALQAFIPTAGRSCTVQDVIDNVTGGCLGILLGIVVRRVWRNWRAKRIVDISTQTEPPN